MSQTTHNPEVRTAVQLSGYPGLVKRDGGWVKINKPTGKGTRAVGDKNETKPREGD